MELHKKFIDLAAPDSLILEIVDKVIACKDSLHSVLQKSIKDQFSNLREYHANKKKLKATRLLLCQLYELNFKTAFESKTIAYFSENHVIDLLECSKLCTLKECQTVMNDILVLQLVLFEDRLNLIQLFEDFRSHYIPDKLQGTSETCPIGWYLNILRCFLQAWKIMNFLNDQKESGASNKTHLEACKKVLLSSVMYDLQSWIQCKENNEWHALYSILLEVINIAKSTRILSPYIHEIMDKDFDLKIICIIGEFVFPLNSSNAEIDYSLIHHENLWTTIQNRMISDDSSSRKEALYLFKRLIEFIDLHEEGIKRVVSLNLIPNKINPFICNKSASCHNDIKQIRTNFILLMEALEEKQKHLVTPCLSLLDSLIEGCVEHKSCGDCFNFSWVYCVFARILNHDNHSIVKYGLLKSLQLNAEAYGYDAFIILIINTLNHTFLYEKHCEECEPEIVTTLTQWFNMFQSEELHLIEKVAYLLHTISWGPVPIFYTLHAMLSTSEHLNTIVGLQDDHLEVIRLLIETNIKHHPPMLRLMSQVALIKIVSRFSEITNLTVFCNLLNSFCEKNNLEPSCWEALRSWLSQMPYEIVLNYVSHTVENLTVDERTVRISMSIFSLMIQLLYEGGVVFQTEQCLVKQEIANLFLFLDKVDVRPYVNIPLTVKIIEFLCKWFDWDHEPPHF
ncbi:hypothetical protein TKK_0014226, partial [Trichogramma kaykai]